jgi:hypothetical protein
MEVQQDEFDRAMKVADLAAYLRARGEKVTTSTLHRWIASGLLPASKVGIRRSTPRAYYEALAPRLERD